MCYTILLIQLFNSTSKDVLSTFYVKTHNSIKQLLRGDSSYSQTFAEACCVQNCSVASLI